MRRAECTETGTSKNFPLFKAPQQGTPEGTANHIPRPAHSFMSLPPCTSLAASTVAELRVAHAHAPYLALLPSVHSLTAAVYKAVRPCSTAKVNSCLTKGSKRMTDSLATGHGLEDRGVEFESPAESRIFISPSRPDRLWG
jgi:hypothetical protein